jgi:hypothetical protein
LLFAKLFLLKKIVKVKNVCFAELYTEGKLSHDLTLELMFQPKIKSASNRRSTVIAAGWKLAR